MWDTKMTPFLVHEDSNFTSKYFYFQLKDFVTFVTSLTVFAQNLFIVILPSSSVEIKNPVDNQLFMGAEI